jgi:Uma2 family endonuclease
MGAKRPRDNGVMASLPNNLITEEEYLAIERAAEFKSEFHDGQMYAMSGGSPAHARLGLRIGGLLDRKLPHGCRAFSSDLRIKSESTGLYTYADCTIVCGKLQYAGSQRDAITNPILIAEVLSPSTELYARGKKFASYRTIPTLREYLLISQSEHYVEQFSKQDDGNWLLRTHAGEEAVVAIPDLAVEIPLGELYASVFDLDSEK